jgi:hypothetical protein
MKEPASCKYCDAEKISVKQWDHIHVTFACESFTAKNDVDFFYRSTACLERELKRSFWKGFMDGLSMRWLWGWMVK